jgi:hypothetical protein
MHHIILTKFTLGDILGLLIVVLMQSPNGGSFQGENIVRCLKSGIWESII